MEFSAEANGLQDETHIIGMQECSTVAVRWNARGELLTFQQQRSSGGTMQEWDVKVQCSGDYDDGMQEWGMEMEGSGDYEDGKQKWGMGMNSLMTMMMECNS